MVRACTAGFMIWRAFVCRPRERGSEQPSTLELAGAEVGVPARCSRPGGHISSILFATSQTNHLGAFGRGNLGHRQRCPPARERFWILCCQPRGFSAQASTLAAP